MPKTTKKATTVAHKTNTATMPEHHCGCGEHCNCHCHGAAHLIKHLIVWAIIFALGMACGKMMNCGHGHKHMMKKHPVFTEGCLDMQSIECPKMQQDILAADVNADNCISLEEYKAFKKEHRNMRAHKKSK